MSKVHGSTDHRNNGLVVFYRNRNTGETRHCFVPSDSSILRFHDGFTMQDSEDGWTPALGMLASQISDAGIENEHLRIQQGRPLS